MKTRNQFTLKLVLGIVLILGVSSCLKKEFDDKKESLEQDNIKNNFTYETTKEYLLELKVKNNLTPVQNVHLELYPDNPLNEKEVFVSKNKNKVIFKGNTDKEGGLIVKLRLPKYYKSIYLYTSHIGLPSLHEIVLDKENIKYTIGLDHSKQKSSSLKSATKMNVHPSLRTLGMWDELGIPDYLFGSEELANDILQNINASLPESRPLVESHPQYLENSVESNLVLEKESEVWVTFVHEGMKGRNTLGYYTYPTGSEPMSQSDISNKTIVFPDVSYPKSGGLVAGNKVQLKYYDEQTQTFKNTFPKNTTIGWFLISDSWDSNSITEGSYIHYSNASLNRESDAEMKRHSVMLYDGNNDLFVLGFENLYREDPVCDQDFNDAVFCVQTSSPNSVMSSSYQVLDTPSDKDNDGVSDAFDDYPLDPTRAYNNCYPSYNYCGTLVFEDLWPYKGDYDFNDMVIDYKITQITNYCNQVVGGYAFFRLKAIGGALRSGFAFQLETPPSNIKYVTGQKITSDYVHLWSNGTEKKQSKAVIVVFDDAYEILKNPGGAFVNTVPGNQYVEPVTLNLSFELKHPISVKRFGTPPYNPFMIVGQKREVEVHLPRKKPTDLADTSLFGKGDDDSDPAIGEYYVSYRYFPWAMDIPRSFDYPIEKAYITKAYHKFGRWVESHGHDYKDWYLDRPGYRDYTLIY